MALATVACTGIVCATPVPVPSGDIQKKGDNTFVRVIKAPFKVIGRLFGRGGKKDDTE